MTNQPTISAAGAVAKSVTVNSGATLTIAAALSINGSTTQGLLNSGTVNNSSTSIHWQHCSSYQLNK